MPDPTPPVSENLFDVCPVSGGYVAFRLGGPPTVQLTRDEALTLAAWLVRCCGERAGFDLAVLLGEIERGSEG